jgi:DNA-binding SARP family transcriptional activator
LPFRERRPRATSNAAGPTRRCPRLIGNARVTPPLAHSGVVIDERRVGVTQLSSLERGTARSDVRIPRPHVGVRSTPAVARGDPSRPVCLRLLGGFELTALGEPVPLPLSAQRLVAFLGLADGPLQRSHVGGSLWPDKPEDRAMANLRAALWRVRQPGIDLVDAVGTRLALHADVQVDVRRIRRPTTIEPGDVAALGEELLPDWYEDDWVIVERERIRHVQLRALEGACRSLSERADYAGAVDAGLRLVAAEPLRESSHRALIAAHLAEGNVGEAVRQFEACVHLVRAELGVEPSDLLVAMSPAFAHRLIRPSPIIRSRRDHALGGARA